MSENKPSLGKCPACNEPLICNRKDRRGYCHASFAGKNPPPKAHYPRFYEEMDVVWCSGCGLVKYVSLPDLEISCFVPEYLGWVARKS